MGKITELSRGSLNGLRRQTNECLKNAYNKGYEDGKKEPREVKAVNVEDTSEYQIGYKQGFINCKKSYPFTEEEMNKVANDEYNKGYADGNKEGYDNGFEQGKKQAISEIPELANKENEMYDKGLEDASDLLAYADERFIRECFPSESNWNLFDLNAKYGLAVLIKEFKKWQEQKKQAEEEIKLGDVVYYKENPESEFFVFKIEDNQISGINMNGVYSNKPVKEWKKTGKNFYELVRYVNNELSIKGENQDA